MSFRDIKIQDIHRCSDVDVNSGLRAKLSYAPADYFFSLPVTTYNDTFSSYIETWGDFNLRPNKALKVIDILIDENELKAFLKGPTGKKKIKSNFSFYIVGNDAILHGAMEELKNVPLIFFIRDSNDNVWQIGSLKNRAYIDNFETTSAKRYDENCGATVNVVCNSKLFKYNGHNSLV